MASFYIVDQNALSIAGHYYNYTATIAKAAIEKGFDVTILSNKRFDGAWKIANVRTKAIFSLTWAEADWQSQSRWSKGNIAYDFVDNLEGIRLTAKDHVLFGTISYPEFFALLSYFADVPARHNLPYCHLQLRYDPTILQNLIEDLSPLFQQFKQSRLLSERIRFYVDTQQLKERLEYLSGLEFRMVPIPFDQERLRTLMAMKSNNHSNSGKAGNVLTVAYMGDARQEKGYSALPDVVNSLWQDYVQAGRIKFLIQSNFNTPGGEPGILPAFEALGKYPSDKVELITKTPPFDEYIEHIWNADIIVIPYDSDRYKYRSSGILTEAMAAAKPVITTRNSWMASQVGADHAVVIDDKQSIGPALKQMIDEYPRYKDAAKARAHQVLQKSTGDSYINEIVASTGNLPAVTDAPRILYVMNGDAIVIPNGAGRIARTQLDYLRSAGYRVVALFLIHDLFDNVSLLEAQVRRLYRNVSEYDFEQIFIGVPGRTSTDTLRQQMLREGLDFSLQNQFEHLSLYEYSTELFIFLRSRQIDAVLLNYATSFAILDSLGLGDTPTICEIHDIQSYQVAIYGNTSVNDNDLTTEFRLLQRARYLISLSRSETAFIHEKISEIPIRTTGVFPSVSGSSVELLAGCRNLAEVISSSGPTRESYNCESARQTNNLEEVVRRFDTKGIDLLYVSSNHRANASGLLWFLEKVYVPYLAPAGVTLVVAGTICDREGWPDIINVHFIGGVRDLAPLYAATKVVVLPITEGAGSPVKTFEALGFGRASVATTIAVRTLERLDGIVIADTAEDFAKSVTALLRSESDRARLGQEALRIATELCDTKHYVNIMNDAFSTVLAHRARSITALNADQPTLDYVEWNTAVQSANRLVRCWLDNSPLQFEAEAIRELATLPSAKTGEILRGILDALLVKRTAPALKADVLLLKQIVSSSGKTCQAGLDLMSAVVEAVKNGQPEATVIANLQEIVDRWPDDPTAHYCLADRLMTAKQRPAIALAHYQKALELGFDEFSVLSNRFGLLFALGCVDDAHSDLARLESLQPQGSYGDWKRELLVHWLVSLLSAFNAGYYEDALILGQAALHHAPDQKLAHFLVAECLCRLNKEPEAALAHYAKALQFGYYKRRVYRARAQLFDKLGRGAEARADAERAEFSDFAEPGWFDGLQTAQRRVVKILRQSKLFDRQYYIRNNPDVARAGVDPIQHYVRTGAKEGRNPNPLFDSDWYLTEYGLPRGKVNPLAHYLTRGAKAGYNPHPLFDASWYLEQNPDVAKSGMNPLEHYLAYGGREGRSPHLLFDGSWYLKRYPDVASAGENPLIHYLRLGATEGRDPNPAYGMRRHVPRYPGVPESSVNPLVHLLRGAHAD